MTVHSILQSLPRYYLNDLSSKHGDVNKSASTDEVDCTHLLIQISLGVFVHHKQEMTSLYECTTVPLCTVFMTTINPMMKCTKDND